MRFSTRSTVPNYLGRREQRRLLVTIGLLALVLFLMREAGKPASWHWFAVLTSQAGPAGAIPEAEIDTRLSAPAEAESVPGAFTSPPEKAAAVPSAELFAGVKPELLAAVRDDTVFRGAEHDAFFHLFEILHDTDARSLESASRGETAFVQLYQQPEEYRGKLVSIRGTVRGVFEFTAARNDYGIVRYHQLWIQPYDNPGLPLVVYVLDLPPGFPVAERVHEEVELTGFFFKRWAYRAQDTIRSTPMLLAKTVHWQRPVVATSAPVSLAIVAGTIVCALLIAGVVVWMAVRGGSTDAGSTPRGRRKVSGASPEESPVAHLKRLAEQDNPPVVAVAAVPPAEDSGGEQRPGP